MGISKWYKILIYCFGFIWKYDTQFKIAKSVPHYTKPTCLPLRISKVKVKLKSDRAFKSSFNARHNSGSLMPAIYIQYNMHLAYIQGGTMTTTTTNIAETSEDDTSIFKQKPIWISCVKQSKINVTHLSRRNNATSASNSSPSCSLSSLHSCLIVTLLFNVLFL